MQDYCLNMSRAPICPSSGVQLINNFHPSVNGAVCCNTPHRNTRAHYFAYIFQVWPPKSGSYLLIVLLMMGILVPETCWGNKTAYFVASSWFFAFIMMLENVFSFWRSTSTFAMYTCTVAQQGLKQSRQRWLRHHRSYAAERMRESTCLTLILFWVVTSLTNQTFHLLGWFLPLNFDGRPAVRNKGALHTLPRCSVSSFLMAFVTGHIDKERKFESWFRTPTATFNYPWLHKLFLPYRSPFNHNVHSR
jgi:hypothetical protein